MMTPTAKETSEQLRMRVAQTAEAATGIPVETWNVILGHVVPTPCSWLISSYKGDPTSNMIARRIAREVSEHFGFAPSVAPLNYEIAMFDWPPQTRADPITHSLPSEEEAMVLPVGGKRSITPTFRS